jgi:hypothetical protein
VWQLGRNAHGEMLSRPDARLLPRPSRRRIQRYRGVRWRAGGRADRAACPKHPQPDGSRLYELVTSHTDRTSSELVVVADLTCEVRAWPRGTWTTLRHRPALRITCPLRGVRCGHPAVAPSGAVDGPQSRPPQTLPRPQASSPARIQTARVTVDNGLPTQALRQDLRLLLTCCGSRGSMWPLVCAGQGKRRPADKASRHGTDTGRRAEHRVRN